MKRKIFAVLAVLCLFTGCVGRTEPEAPDITPQPPAVDPVPEVPDRPTEAELAETRLRERIGGMTLEKKVGQMFFVRCPDAGAAEDIQTYHLGGLLLFGRDFKSADGTWLTSETLRNALAAYQAASDIPLFIGSDEEGGTVTRVSRNPNICARPYASPQTLYAAGGMDAVRADAADKASELGELGINVNFAPVCDVSTDSDDFIYTRSFGQDAAATAEYVRAVTEEYTAQNYACVLKHFPGYGNNADTHTGVTIDKRPYETFEQSDFLPFQAGIAAGAPFVLVSHNVVECMDDALPASLSPAVHQILREKLGFAGIAITDDLAMDAVKEYADGEAAVLAVLAGNDMLITSDYWNDIPAVLAAVADGRITEREIDAHVLRILRCKQAQGWIE